MFGKKKEKVKQKAVNIEIQRLEKGYLIQVKIKMEEDSNWRNIAVSRLDEVLQTILEEWM
jgi:hypothetical protein